MTPPQYISIDETLSPFQILANEKVVKGYTESICYECTIKPTDLPEITITKDKISITADPYDCNSSLSDKSFVSTSIPYSSAGPT